MATDVLLLGPIEFTDFSTPDKIPFGGRHSLAVHKLIGGQRVVDALGPDDADISWSGRFFSDNALSNAMALDALRAQGGQLPLSFGGMSYTVVISEFKAEIEHYPQDVPYSITCLIVTNSMQGGLGGLAAGVDSLVSGDLSAAVSLVGGLK